MSGVKPLSLSASELHSQDRPVTLLKMSIIRIITFTVQYCVNVEEDVLFVSARRES